MIKTGTAKNTDNTISTLMATAGWYQANESLQEIVRRVIKNEKNINKKQKTNTKWHTYRIMV